jgi:hypothetical protein
MSAMAQRRTAAAAAIMILFSVLQYVLITVNAKPADAHHPEITASVDCVEKGTRIQFEATAWVYDGDQDRRHNNDVRVTVDGTEVGSGSFNSGNGYFFSGSFDAAPYFGETIEIVVTAVARWGVGENLASAGEWRSTFIKVDEKCEKEPEPVRVAVSGICEPGDKGGANGYLSVTIDPASGAAVTVNGVVYTESTSGVAVEAPGVYGWTAVAADGFVLAGASSGEVDVPDCKEVPKPVTVAVSGKCVTGDDGGANGYLSVTIDPASGAAVTVNGVVYTESTSDVAVEAPGVYGWTAVAADGYVLDGASSGEVDVPDCKQLDVTIAVTGECIADGNFARMTVVVDPAGGARVVLESPDEDVYEFTESGSIDGDLGTWTYSAVAGDGYVLKSEPEGSVVVNGCKRTTTTTQPEKTLSTLGDLVWFDENRNGRQDDPVIEFPINGATVTLQAPDGTVLAQQVTGEDGLYLFDELEAGTYRVKVCLPGADYTVNNALGVSDDLDSDVFVLADAPGCAMTGLITLPAGVTDLTWDAGLVVEVKGIQIEPTTTTAPPPIEPVTVDTLPFTGFETEETIFLALGVLAGGALLLFAATRREERVPASLGTSWSNRLN